MGTAADGFPVRSGTYSCAFQALRGGGCFNDTSWRAEIVGPNVNRGSNYFLGFSFFQPTSSGSGRGISWSPWPAKNGLIAQQCRSLNAATGNNVDLRINGTGGTSTPNCIEVGSSKIGGWCGLNTRGGWHDFVFQQLFDTGGWVSLWHRQPGQSGYTQVLNRASANTINSGATGVYVKYGMYQPSDTVAAPATIFGSGMRIATTFEEAAPPFFGGIAPPPPPSSTDTAPPTVTITSP